MGGWLFPTSCACLLVLASSVVGAESELAAYPAEVQKRCQPRARREKTKVTTTPLALFGSDSGLLLECRRPCKSDCYEFTRYWVFVLRQEAGAWRVVHRASESWEQGVVLKPLQVGARQLLVEEHHSAGAAMPPLLAIYGGAAGARKLERLFFATMADDADYTQFGGLCRTQVQGEKITITYLGEGTFRQRMKPKVSVKLRRVERCKR
jgi:hypothetical protein